MDWKNLPAVPLNYVQYEWIDSHSKVILFF